MNSNNAKTLLITTALAARVLSIAQSLTATDVTKRNEAAGTTDVTEFDGFTIVHHNSEYGEQRLLVDQIHEHLYSVSFVGSEKYLEMIGSEGWVSSAEALVNYLVDLHPELELNLGEFRYSYVGEQYVVYSLASEDDMVVDLDSDLGQLLFGKLVAEAGKEIDAVLEQTGEAFEEVLRTVEDAVQTDAIDESIDAGSQAADHPDDVDSPQAASLRQKVMKFVTSPAGVATCVCVAGLAFFAGRAALSAATNGTSEELLG